MKSKRSLVTALIGLAMLAAPISAAARDNDRYNQNNVRASHAARFANAQARHEFRNQRGNGSWASAPAADRDWREDRNEANRNWGNANQYRNYGYQNYGHGGYYAPSYRGANSYYGAPGYAGGSSCTRAQRIVNVYQRDRYTGHPAAAADLLRQNRWAFSGACGGVAQTGGLFSGFSGAPAYNNYGGNKGGYGQPYGGTSMIAPLLQQYIH